MADLENEFVEEPDIITLVDQMGNDVDFYHVATIDYKEKWYVFLQPVEPIDGIAEDEVLIYELGMDENGDDKFIPIEDEALLDAVFNEYLKEAEEDGCCCGEECDCEDGCDCDDTCDCEGGSCSCGCKD